MRVGIRSILASGKICKTMLLGLVTIALVIPGGDVALSQSSTGSSSSTPTPFDYPSALGTLGLGINSTGQIVGYFLDTSNNIHGFLRNADGTFPTTIDVQNSTLTTAYGINGTGQIVGYFADSSRHYHGFLRSAAGIFAPTIDVPNSIQTYAYGINGTGQIAGTFVSNTSTSGGACGSNPHQAGCTHGFLRSADGTTFTPIDVPGSIETDAYGINGSGQIVGYFYDTSANLHGFLRPANGTTFLTIDVQNSTYTQAFGINDTGQIVGAFGDSTSAVHGFLRDATSGTSTPFDAPSATYTDGFGINGSGQISGYFYDASLKVHGFFMGKPDPQLKVPQWFQAGIPAFKNGIPVYDASSGYPGNFWGGTALPNYQYDFSPGHTIVKYGCALTALTMALNFFLGDRITPTLANPNAGVPPAAPKQFDLNAGLPLPSTGWKDAANPMMPNGWKGFFEDITHDLVWDGLAVFAQTKLMIRVFPYALTNGFPVIQNDPYQTLDNILRNGVPVILPILDSSGKAVHFVVITGKDSPANTYFVNDPGAAYDPNGNPVQTLSELPNTAWYQGHFHTTDAKYINLSLSNFRQWIVFARIDKPLQVMDPNTPQVLAAYSDDPVEFILTDPQGRRTGFDPVTNTSYQDIPASAYSTTVYCDEQDFSSCDPPLKALNMANQIAGQYTLDVIGTGSGGFTVEVRTSDAAGNWITQTYSGTTAPGVSSQFTFLGAVTTFAIFSANVAINSSKNQVAVGGQFTLGAGSPGINPLTQPVTLQVGEFLITIPAGSFHLDSHGNYVFLGTINGVQLAAGIQPQGGNKYAYGIAGQNASNLPTANPVDIRLSIGGDGGDVSVNATFAQ